PPPVRESVGAAHTVPAALHLPYICPSPAAALPGLPRAPAWPLAVPNAGRSGQVWTDKRDEKSCPQPAARGEMWIAEYLDSAAKPGSDAPQFILLPGTTLFGRWTKDPANTRKILVGKTLKFAPVQDETMFSRKHISFQVEGNGEKLSVTKWSAFSQALRLRASGKQDKLPEKAPMDLRSGDEVMVLKYPPKDPEYADKNGSRTISFRVVRRGRFVLCSSSLMSKLPPASSRAMGTKSKGLLPEKELYSQATKKLATVVRHVQQWNDGVTHLVIPRKPSTLSAKLLQALVNGSHVVSVDWVEALLAACKACKPLPKEKDFPFHTGALRRRMASVSEDQFSSTSTQILPPGAHLTSPYMKQGDAKLDFSIQRGRTKLFEGYYVVNLDPVAHSSEDVLVKAGAHKVVCAHELAPGERRKELQALEAFEGPKLIVVDARRNMDGVDKLDASVLRMSLGYVTTHILFNAPIERDAMDIQDKPDRQSPAMTPPSRVSGSPIPKSIDIFEGADDDDEAAHDVVEGDNQQDEPEELVRQAKRTRSAEKATRGTRAQVGAQVEETPREQRSARRAAPPSKADGSRSRSLAPRSAEAKSQAATAKSPAPAAEEKDESDVDDAIADSDEEPRRTDAVQRGPRYQSTKAVSKPRVAPKGHKVSLKELMEADDDDDDDDDQYDDGFVERTPQPRRQRNATRNASAKKDSRMDEANSNMVASADESDGDFSQKDISAPNRGRNHQKRGTKRGTSSNAPPNDPFSGSVADSPLPEPKRGRLSRQSPRKQRGQSSASAGNPNITSVAQYKNAHWASAGGAGRSGRKTFKKNKVIIASKVRPSVVGWVVWRPSAGFCATSKFKQQALDDDDSNNAFASEFGGGVQKKGIKHYFVG
ncbi:unnamed protein product, partial [Durusdinium trenchii]